MSKIIIGKVLKPQGIKGEIKIDVVDADKELVKSLKEIYVGEDIFKVESVKNLVNGVFIKLNGINDRNQAELLRGKSVAFAKENMPKLKKGRYLIADILGCDIVVNGEIRGEIENILQYGSADVYVVKGKNGFKDFMFPCLKTVLKNVDVESKIIELNLDILEQIAVYED